MITQAAAIICPPNTQATFSGMANQMIYQAREPPPVT